MKKCLFALTWLAIAGVSISSSGQTVSTQPSTTYEEGPDGVRYRVTRQVVQKSIPTTEYQSREQKVYHPQVSTEYQSYQQTYYMPVTEYQWVPRLRNWWNPFADAYWTHELTPVTRWEVRPATVQIPVARTNWVEESRTVQVPVTTYRTVPEEYTQKVVESVAPRPAGLAPTDATATSVANRLPVGGQQLQSDPPRYQSPWATSAGDGFRR
jgi:hypothetical protein